MATGNSSISLASLDFDTLKADLKNFLRTQSAFKDYDYEGSNMNVLLDVLSYNTFMNAFYLNMTASEMVIFRTSAMDFPLYFTSMVSLLYRWPWQFSQLT